MRRAYGRNRARDCAHIDAQDAYVWSESLVCGYSHHGEQRACFFLVFLSFSLVIEKLKTHTKRSLQIRDVFETIDSRLQEVGATAWAGIAKCKALARFIKARRTPAWPTLQTSPLPDKALADVLVENYLQTTESLYRILHIPTFREQYNALWVADAPQNPGFIIQVKLVLALGAIPYDDLFTMRETALQWVFEAKTWLCGPKFKAHLDISSLQTSILLLLAEERLGLVGDSMWSDCGVLLRRAIFMGLHRDPARLPDRSLLTCEMHRRLWNTIAELNVQSSLGSGGPVFLSMSDFDTKPPGNFDDEQLLEDSPVPRPLEECTQMTLALALRETFSQRLDVLRFLNDVSTGGSYDETLRLDHALRTAYKALGRRLQSCTGHGAKRTLTSFELRLIDTVMYRYLSALHVPYYVAAMQETKYAYSRTVVVDCAMKMWSLLGGNASIEAAQSRAQGAEEGERLLRRLVTTGAGFFMVSAIYSSLLLIMELRAQLKESDGLGPRILRPDLLAVLQESQEWALQVIKAGHTNVKGYLLLRIIAAQIDAMSRNLSTEAHVAALIEAAIEVSNTCCNILTEMAGKLQGAENGPAAMQQSAAPISTPPSMGAECSYTASCPFSPPFFLHFLSSKSSYFRLEGSILTYTARPWMIY